MTEDVYQQVAGEPTLLPHGTAGTEAEVEERPGDVGPAPARRGFHVSPRTAFVGLAIVLALVLIAFIVYLLWFLGRPEVLTGAPARQGVQPIWQVFGPGEGAAPLFDRPMGVAIGSQNRIYVTDAGNSRVCVFDSQGRFLFEFGSFGVAKPAAGAMATYQPGSLNYPVGIDTDDQGNVYVASLYNDSIEVFDAEGTPLRRFPDPLQVTGRGGSGVGGRGIAVTDVAVSGDRLYATDSYQVVVFSLEGEVLDQWGRPGLEPGNLDRPNGIAVSADGSVVYVSDSNHNRVTAFTPEGEVIWQVGEISGGIEDKQEREIELPRGLTVAADGSVLVTDAFSFELIRISANGEIIGRYGERGMEPGQFNFANDVEVLRGFAVIADKGAGRVQMVRLVN